MAAWAGTEAAAGNSKAESRKHAQHSMEQANAGTDARARCDVPDGFCGHDVGMNNWKFFIGACILSGGLLLKAGAPAAAVLLGIAGVGLLNWRRQRRTR